MKNKNPKKYNFTVRKKVLSRWSEMVAFNRRYEIYKNIMLSEKQEQLDSIILQLRKEGKPLYEQLVMLKDEMDEVAKSGKDVTVFAGEIAKIATELDEISPDFIRLQLEIQRESVGIRDMFFFSEGYDNLKTLFDLLYDDCDIDFEEVEKYDENESIEFLQFAYLSVTNFFLRYNSLMNTVMSGRVNG